VTDVLLRQANDGGEISFVNGQAVMSDGLETAVYLSLFGGNEDDSGIVADDPLQWWGNFGESDQAKHYRSETQSLLRSLPLIPFNLRRLEEAGTRDLDWLIQSSVATSVTVAATIPALNTLALVVNVEIDGVNSPFKFTAQSAA
jgi:phage gp46-like protein